MAKKILIVDDDLNILNLLVNFLTIKGFQVETAENGYFSLRKLETFKPDIILLDIMMPRLDGYEVCSRIRSLPDSSLSRIPIIIMSALNHLNDVKKAIASGANDYVVKPLALQVLYDKINRYIKNDALLKKEVIDDSLFMIERLEKGLVISIQGILDDKMFEIIKRNLQSLPNGDFVIILFENIKNAGTISPNIIEECMELFSLLAIPKKAIAIEQKDLFILMESPALRRRLIVYNTLMEAFEGVRK